MAIFVSLQSLDFLGNVLFQVEGELVNLSSCPSVCLKKRSLFLLYWGIYCILYVGNLVEWIGGCGLVNIILLCVDPYAAFTNPVVQKSEDQEVWAPSVSTTNRLVS